MTRKATPGEEGKVAAGDADAADAAAPRPLFTFDTTHMALWAEEVARDRGIPAEAVPAPPETRAKCGLALETLDRFVPPLRAALDGAGVAFYAPGQGP